MVKKNTSRLPSIGFKILTHCDVAVILSKEADSKGEWVHVPCLLLSFSEVQRKMQDFYFNLHARMLSWVLIQHVIPEVFLLRSLTGDGRFSDDSTFEGDKKIS